MKRPDVWIQIRVCPAATTVELNDVGEAGQTAIVHIGRCLSDLAQRGCLERPTMAIPACDCGAACVCRRGWFTAERPTMKARPFRGCRRRMVERTACDAHPARAATDARRRGRRIEVAAGRS